MHTVCIKQRRMVYACTYQFNACHHLTSNLPRSPHHSIPILLMFDPLSNLTLYLILLWFIVCLLPSASLALLLFPPSPWRRSLHKHAITWTRQLGCERACARVRNKRGLLLVCARAYWRQLENILPTNLQAIVNVYVDTHVDVLSEPADSLLRELPGSSCHQPLLVSLIHPLIQLGCALHSSGNVELVIWRERGWDN